MDTGAAMRDHFQLDPGLIFLNHGSFGACPRAVVEAQRRWQDELEANPVAFLSRRSDQLLGLARQVLARYLGAQAEHLAFVPNATTGVNIVAQSLALQPGDEVLSTNHEYGACDATFGWVCARRGAVYRKVDIPLPYQAEDFVDRLMAQVSSRTRLIFLSHITSATALIFPVGEVCAAARARGILTLVDGAHAPGQIALNLQQIGADFYTGNGHKWMCGPKGSAFLHVEPRHHAQLRGPVISWGQVAEQLQAQGDEGSVASAALNRYTGADTLQRRLQWQGTRDVSAWLALPQAIVFQESHDWATVRVRCHEAAVYAMHMLCQRWGLAPIARDQDFAQMAAVPLPPHLAPDLQQRLFEDSRIEIPVTQHEGRRFLRISVQGYTTAAEVQALLDAPALAH
jgi:isopenicillin-N epimerase